MSAAEQMQQTERRAARTLSREDYDRFLPMVRRMAMHLARKVPTHVPVADLVSCAWVGLLEAYSRASDGMPSAELDAYVSYRIRGAMLDYLRSLDSMGREMRKHSRDLARTIRDLTKDFGRPPTEDEIAKQLKLDPAKYQALLSRLARAGMSRLELIDLDAIDVGQEVETAEDEIGRKRISAAVAEAVTKLPDRLQQVLALYYQEDCTLKEIGVVLGVTESRVSQLHTEAVHRLRAAIGRE